MKPKVEAWAHRVRILGKISRRHPKLVSSGLGVSLQLNWQYLQRTIPKVGTLMGPIEETLIDTFFPTLFRREEVNTRFRKSKAIELSVAA